MCSLYKRYVYRLAVSPFFYVLGAVLLVVSFLNSLFSSGGFFSFFPLFSIILLPALASIIPWNDGERDLPMGDMELAFSAVFALLTASFIFLLLTLPLSLSLSENRGLESASIVTGYLGLFLFLASASALCVFFSFLLRNKGAAFAGSSLVLAFLSFAHVVSRNAGTPAFLSNFLSALSFSWHSDAASKGILDSRDLVFYLVTFLFFTALAATALQRRRGNESWTFRRQQALAIAAFILLILNSNIYYGRLDLTSGKKFSVSRYSSVLLSEAEAPLTISYYRSGSLRRVYSPVRDVEDFIRLYADAGREVRYEIIDPAVKGLESQLDSYGIRGQDMELGGASGMRVSQAYSAIAINYRGQTELIPFVLGVDSLEYDLSFRIQKLVRGKERKVTCIVGNGLSLENDYAYLASWLAFQGFQLKEADVSALTDAVLDQSSSGGCLLILGSSELSHAESAALASYLDGGGKAFIATTPYRVSLNDGWTVERPSGLPYDNLTLQLMKYGINFRDSLTASSSCFLLSMQESGTSASVEQRNYPLWPVLPPQKSAKEGLLLFWPCAFDLANDVAEDAGFILESILETSASSWQYEGVDGVFVTNPFSVYSKPLDGDEKGSFSLGVCVYRGERPSFYVLGDQYALSSAMMAFAASNASSLDTRGLSFLTDAFLRLDGEDELLKLKYKGKKIGVESDRHSEQEESRRFVRTVFCCLLFPLLMLLALFIAFRIARGKIRRRMLIILGKSS